MPARTTDSTRDGGAPPDGVDVVVPFAGSQEEAARALELAVGLTGDARTVTLADNEPSVSLARFAGDNDPRLSVVRALARQGSYYARNVGAATGSAPWILFVDADCIAPADLPRRYDVASVPADVGVVAGSVRAGPGETLAARYAASRALVDERHHVEGPGAPAGITANLLVRREAFEQVGGFVEEAVSGADLDLCWRLAAAGWTLEHRPGAAVEHAHPDTVGGLALKARRYGAGRRWLRRRHPNAVDRPRLVRPFVRGPVVALAWLLFGRGERARFKAIDIRLSAALLRGWLFDSNLASPLEATDATRSDPSR